MIKAITFILISTVSLSSLFAKEKNSPEPPKELVSNCERGCCSSSRAKSSPTENVLKRSPRNEDAKVYFVSPKDGDIVKGDLKVVFGLKGMGIAPAGINFPNTGHHHLLVNVDKLPNMNMPIPASKQHLHFGLGQTETTLKLPPGKHTLQLLVGNYLHIPHDKEVISKKITITVK